MSFPHWIAVTAVSFLPLAATAQQLQQPSPTDANANVPAVGYVSAFENYRTTPDEKATPDQVWRAANEEVTSQDMQGEHMSMPNMGPAASGKLMSMPGMEQRSSEDHMSMPGMRTAKPEPKAGVAPSDPHAGHHNMQGK